MYTKLKQLILFDAIYQITNLLLSQDNNDPYVPIFLEVIVASTQCISDGAIFLMLIFTIEE